MVKLTLLSGISKKSDRWAVKIGVFRRWNVCQKSAPGLLSCASMLFVDTEVIFCVDYVFQWEYDSV